MDIPRRTPRLQLRKSLKALLTDPGPYLSLFYGVSNHHETIAARADRDLADMDLTDAQRFAAQEHVASRSESDVEMLAVVVASTGQAVSFEFPDPPAHDHVSLDSVPRLGPILEADQSLVHHVVAVVSDDTLSIVTVPRRGEVTTHTLSIGEDGDVPALIAHIVDESETTLLVLAGDDPLKTADLRAALRTRIPFDTYIATHEIEPEEPHDLADGVVRAVADVTARRTVDMLRLWRFQHAGGAAVHGVVPTTEALAEGTARVLMLHDDVDDRRQAWFGRDFQRVAIDLDAASPMGSSEELQAGRFPDVLIRAALGRELPVVILPALPDDRFEDGVGVLLDPDLISNESVDEADLRAL